MATSYGFHPEALFEYAEATTYYLEQASPRVAERFVAATEAVGAALVRDPAWCPVVEVPEIRRYVFLRFPYVIYYRWKPEREQITIYAVMHCNPVIPTAERRMKA